MATSLEAEAKEWMAKALFDNGLGIIDPITGEANRTRLAEAMGFNLEAVTEVNDDLWEDLFEWAHDVCTKYEEGKKDD